MAIFRHKIWGILRMSSNHGIKLSSVHAAAKVQEIGSIEQETEGIYKSGQCFIHRTFAYRGIILCSWKAQLMDRDDRESPKIVTYYQALIDDRDAPFIKVHSDVGRFLGGNDKIVGDGLRFVDPGLDQVHHSDVIPYKPTIDNPIHHRLFTEYFVVRQTKGESERAVVPKVTLQEWKKKHMAWLVYTQVHKMITDNIRVTVMSLYMGKRSVSHWWRYCVRIENLDKIPVILQGQRWGIYTGNGELQTVRGIGILGNLPALTSEAPAIQYCSHVTLLAPRGHMWGYYLIQKKNAKNTFLCPVPSFALESVLPTP